MNMHLDRTLGLRFPPLAIFYAKELPAEVRLSRPLCSMLLVARAARGETMALGRDSCLCHGAASGFGLEPMLSENFPGGPECFLRFLSVGNQGWEHGESVIRRLREANAPKVLIEEFTEGEGFLKTPELVDEWLSTLPECRPEGPFVLIKPLRDIKPGEKPKVVAFLADPDQLSALVVLANYARPGIDNVRIPFGPGCGCFGLLPFAESEKENPRAVVGLTDISARLYLRKPLGRDILSFTVPFKLYEEMEANAPESFLTRFAWKTIHSSAASQQAAIASWH
ncbi:MAG: DUF169 domain-containing protein [Desulfovibrio sp.]|jgi:hypothetical protein|nr:DUF169 domain-containing protein [Desulfovibrio sp.]